MSEPAERPAGGIKRTDLTAGLCMVVLSAAFAVTAYGYDMGRLIRMGAGFYPFCFAVAGVALGAAIAVRAVLAPAGEEARVQWRSLLFVSAAFVAFGVMVEPAGVVAAILVSTVLGARADPEAKLGESALLGLGLAAMVWVIFVYLLGLNIPVMPGGR